MDLVKCQRVSLPAVIPCLRDLCDNDSVTDERICLALLSQYICDSSYLLYDSYESSGVEGDLYTPCHQEKVYSQPEGKKNIRTHGTSPQSPQLLVPFPHDGL